jgi:hypothetical protein
MTPRQTLNILMFPRLQRAQYVSELRQFQSGTIQNEPQMSMDSNAK